MLLDDTHDAGGIYLIWLSDTHYYGGRARFFRKRWRSHLRDLKAGKHENPRMQAVFDKHGRFDPEIVSVLLPHEQREAEQVWLDTHFRQPGCVNLSPFAKGGCENRSPETRAKMSRTRSTRPDLVLKAQETLELNRMHKGDKKSEAAVAKIRLAASFRIGLKQSPDTIAKRVAKILGRKNTPETLQRMSDAAKIRARMFPTVHGPETRALISSQQDGRVWVNNGAENRRSTPEEAEVLLTEGWRPGRKPRPVGVYRKDKGQPASPAALAAAAIAGEKRKGVPRSPEAIAKTAAGNLGRKNGPEALANLRAAGEKRRGRKRDPEVVAQISQKLRGKKHTPEAIARMSAAKAKPVDGVLPPEGICSSDFELIRLFPAEGVLSVADIAAKMQHLSMGAVRQRVCRCKTAGLIQGASHGYYRLSRPLPLCEGGSS